MKNKDRYDLRHITWEIDFTSVYAEVPYKHVTLFYQNMPIISLKTEKQPFREIMDWMELELEDY